MIRALGSPVGVEVDLGWTEITLQLVRRYREGVGQNCAGSASTQRVPLGLALTLRGGPVPPVALREQTVSVHGGHALRSLAPLVTGDRYRVRTRIDRIFEKSGRSGPLTVIARSASLRSQRGGVVWIEDHQIVRWRSNRDPSLLLSAPSLPLSPDGPMLGEPTTPEPLELGMVVASEVRPAPDAAALRRYAEILADRELIFTDPDAARSLGYADVIVPGPVQGAILEDLVCRQLPGWHIASLAFTFRISLVASEAISLSATVTQIDESGGSQVLGLDLAIENADGERAAVGSATLMR
ncbi:MAG: hypothetical protein ABI629_05165 [bacterium]